MSALPDTAVRAAPPAPQHAAFLRVPPFPGSRFRNFEQLPQPLAKPVSLDNCLAQIRETRVGGTYWAPQPDLPSAYLLVRSAAAASSCDSLVERHGAILMWLAAPTPAASQLPAMVGEFDPWHMLSGAGALVCHIGDEVSLVAALLGVPTYLVDPRGGPPRLSVVDQAKLFGEALPAAASFSDPFGDRAIDLVELTALCGFWRSMIDANRPIQRGVGFAFWKQQSVLPLLWGGGDSSGFFANPADNDPDGTVAIWRSKAPPDVVERLECRGTPIVEVEDGFLRSSGLGADCVPPLSITVDPLGPYFDPAQPSGLENLLQNGDFDPELIGRASRLRESIVAAGLGKYDRDDAILDRIDAKRRHILVPGQVEDDRSILTGGSGLVSNLELLKRVREQEPDALLIYKPHPDVVAGHRKGNIPERLCRQFADKVVTDSSISALIAMVDEVHVNTSLAGFEALMRHKPVTTHGVPFYAGWGLTRDLGPVPARRTSKRSLDELVAATLLLYPRYLDPVSGLPCPAEVVVDRLCAGAGQPQGVLVAARRLQGKVSRILRGVGR